MLCLPRKVTVDIAKCHACHAKRRGATAPHLKPSAPPKPAQCHACHACHAKCSYMSPSAVPATQSAATCLQVLCLPLKVQLHVAKRHACHAKRRGATAPHLKPSAPPEPAQCHKCLPRKVTVDVTKCRMRVFFPTEHDVPVRKHLRDDVGTWQRTTQNNGLSLVLRHGDIIMKTAKTDG